MDSQPLDGTIDPKPKDYVAFISYSQRADSRTAKELQSRLKYFGYSFWRVRSRSIFRDSTGLLPSASLPDAIIAALDRSCWFILLASRDSAKSDWVGLELEHWFSHGGGLSHLIIVQTEGEVDHGTPTLGLQESGSEILHPELIENLTSVPLLVDLSNRRSGRWRNILRRDRRVWHDCLASIVGKLEDKNKEELLADERRRRRGFLIPAALTMIAAFVVISIAGWGWIAADQRAETSDLRTEFEALTRSSLEAETIAEAIELGIQAYQAGVAADIDETNASRALLDALLIDDRPLETFVGRPDTRVFTGSHQGFAVSEDGSAFAFVEPDGSVQARSVWSLTNLLSTDANLQSGHETFSVEIDLDSDGERLLIAGSQVSGQTHNTRISVHEMSSDGKPVADVSIQQTAHPIAVSFGHAENVVGLVKSDGTLEVLDLESADVSSLEIGESQQRANADILRVNFSLDQNRVCIFGDRVQYIQIDPPLKIADLSPGAEYAQVCFPEGCDGDTSNLVLGWATESARQNILRCLDPNGPKCGHRLSSTESWAAPQSKTP